MVNFLIYSPCHYLEGIKDALCYNFRRLRIGQNCRVVCTNKGGHRNALLNKQDRFDIWADQNITIAHIPRVHWGWVHAPLLTNQIWGLIYHSCVGACIQSQPAKPSKHLLIPRPFFSAEDEVWEWDYIAINLEYAQHTYTCYLHHEVRNFWRV